MSQSIIEKVAVEIGGIHESYCNPCTPEKILKCEECLETAKRVIEAMREPTEYMLKAGGDDHCSDDYYGPRECWEKMIDAALNEK